MEFLHDVRSKHLTSAQSILIRYTNDVTVFRILSHKMAICTQYSKLSCHWLSPEMIKCQTWYVISEEKKKWNPKTVGWKPKLSSVYGCVLLLVLLGPWTALSCEFTMAHAYAYIIFFHAWHILVCFITQLHMLILTFLGPLLLTWFNFNPSMGK